MDFMEEKEGHIVFYDKQEEQMMYKSDELIQPIEHLSAGYQSLIWTVFDIAYRMAVLNPSKLDKIAETAGVVLIDEIDMAMECCWGIDQHISKCSIYCGNSCTNIICITQKYMDYRCG